MRRDTLNTGTRMWTGKEHDMIKTLEGIKVISFTKAAAGISCAKILAEYGAERLKKLQR